MAKPADIKVLVVDDDKVLRECVVGLFKAFGFRTFGAHSGNRAWDLYLQEKVHIIITDIRMADGGGMELLQKIRLHNMTTPKVFVITGYADDVVEDIYSFGGDGLFNKPFSTELLAETVRRSMLRLEDRWSQEPKALSGLQFKREFANYRESEKNGFFALGRAGFFLAFESSPEDVSVGQEVSFELKTGHPEVPVLQGSGAIRWLRHSTPGVRGGAGIEIQYLEPLSRKRMCRYVDEKNKKGFSASDLATIPTGVLNL